ncbi:hypothetical protein CXG81DRAFT_7039, partial [Caulochytrium protostelioides]
LPPDVFKKVALDEYHRRFYDAGCRPDGRAFGQFEAVAVKTGTLPNCVGSAMVKLGDTTFLAGVRAEIGLPHASAPQQGMVVPNVDFPALCSSQFRPGPPPESTAALSHQLVELLQSGDVVDTQALCIARGKAVWVLYVDIVCLNYAGHALDGAAAALYLALADTTIPPVSYDPFSDEVHLVPPSSASRETSPMRLTLKRPFVASTFAVLFGDTVVAHPNEEEESLAEALCTIVVDDAQRLCGTYKRGAVPIPLATLEQMTEAAQTRTKAFL